MITRIKLIKKYIEFFKSKGHKEIPNASLIPKGDPTVLFTTAGMHPLVPYLLGQKHPLGKRLCNAQKLIRTGDIEEVGDDFHHTFFEMLGNWSLGDYWKEEAIKMTFEFITKELKIKPEELTVTCFKGDKNAPKDLESEKIWKELGINKIKFLGKEDNWWGPTGQTGPCGPDTEIFVNGFEIGNNVLMQYYKDESGEIKEAKQKNIDFGGGVERTLAIINGLNDDYLTDTFKQIIEKIEELSGKVYGKHKEETRAMRIIADHLKATAFIIADGIIPSNTEHGYVLRRLIRRAIRYKQKLDIKEPISKAIIPLFKIYDDYKHLLENEEKIIQEIDKEESKFMQTLEKGLSIFKKVTQGKKVLSGKDAFLLYQSYGFPIEMIIEEAKTKKIKVDEKAFQKELEKHQELSRTASAGKFKSGLADHGEKTTRLHTAHHLLLAALRKVLGKSIVQKGSNITPERLRLDFSFDRKLTSEEIKKVEDLVNQKINEAIPVTIETMSPKKAIELGALGEFQDKYTDKVTVYTIEGFSKEICAGPHVKNTKEISQFKILKEEASSAGVRRIKATLV